MFSLLSIILLIIFLALSAGLIVLQIILSKKERALPGLILPIISLVFSLIVCAGISLYAVNPVYSTEVIAESESDTYYGYSESEIDNSIGIIGGADGPTQVYTSGSVLSSVLPTFLLFNIPTAVYLILFFCFHNSPRSKEQSELDKMTIQDL